MTKISGQQKQQKQNGQQNLKLRKLIGIGTGLRDHDRRKLTGLKRKLAGVRKFIE